MQVTVVDEYVDVTVKFRDDIFERKLSGNGNDQARYHMNKQALKNIKYVNITKDTQVDCDVRTYRNLCYVDSIGIYMEFLCQSAKIQYEYKSIQYPKSLLN